MAKAIEVASLSVPPSDRQSRSEQIAGVISERINRGELEPGDKLPTESAFAQHFGVSRAVVREAIARLKAEGLVETFQGSGGFVRQPQPMLADLDPATRTSIKSLLDLISVRRVIEAEIAEAAARNRNARELDRIERAFDALCRAERENRDGVAEDCEFHLAIAAACGNDYWKAIAEALSRNMTMGIKVTRTNEALRKDFASAAHEEHGAVLEAIRAGDPDAARRAAQLHLQNAAERTLSADRDFWQNGGAPVHELGRASRN